MKPYQGFNTFEITDDEDVVPTSQPFPTIDSFSAGLDPVVIGGVSGGTAYVYNPIVQINERTITYLKDQAGGIKETKLEDQVTDRSIGALARQRAMILLEELRLQLNGPTSPAELTAARSFEDVIPTDSARFSDGRVRTGIKATVRSTFTHQEQGGIDPASGRFGELTTVTTPSCVINAFAVVDVDYEREEREGYEPGLWVGVRTLSGDTLSDSNVGGPYLIQNIPNLLIWEPPIADGEDRAICMVVDKLHWAAPDGATISEVDAVPASFMPITVTPMAHFGNPAEPANFAYSTSNGLWLTGPVFTYDPFFNSDEPEYWQQTAWLYDDLGLMTLPRGEKMWGLTMDGDGFPLKPAQYGLQNCDDLHDPFYGTNNLTPFESYNAEIDAKGTILSGNYVVKFLSSSYDECYESPHDFLLRVIVGKPPNTLTKDFYFTTPHPSNYYHEMIPYGWYLLGDVPGRGTGPNPHAPNVWQDAVSVDVKNGKIELIEGYALTDNEGYKLTTPTFHMDMDEMGLPWDYSGISYPFEPNIESVKGGCGCDVMPVPPEAAYMSFVPWALSGTRGVPIMDGTYLVGLRGVIVSVINDLAVNTTLCKLYLYDWPYHPASPLAGRYPLGAGTFWLDTLQIDSVFSSNVVPSTFHVGDTFTVGGYTVDNLGYLRGPTIVLNTPITPGYQAEGYENFHIAAINYYETFGWQFSVINNHWLPIVDPKGRPVNYIL